MTQHEGISEVGNRLERFDAYQRDGWKDVNGWLYDGAFQLTVLLDRCQKRAGVQGHLGEIGVYQGKFFILLALITRAEERAVAVDLFDDNHPNGPYYDALMENIDIHIGSRGWVNVVGQDSTTLNADTFCELAGGSYRMISIDGGHTADIVQSDLRVAQESLSTGGLILLDDYFDRKFPGVSEGTCRFFLQDNPTVAPFAITGNKVFLACKKHQRDYFEFARDIAGEAMLSEQEMFGDPVAIYRI